MSSFRCASRPLKSGSNAAGSGEATNRFLSLILGVSMLISTGAAASDPAGPPDDSLPLLPQGQEWNLTWHDEFNAVQIDTNKWDIMGDWRRRDDWWVKEDSYLDGKGSLVIRTKQDGERRTSGGVRTKGKFEHAFGYWVARVQLQKQPGHWTAFWLMSDKVNKIGEDGRDATEIDICEFPRLDGHYEINLHWDGYGKAHKSAGRKVTVPTITNGFHTFALWWTPTEYVFYCDGREQWRTTAGGVSQQPEYIKFSAEIGKWAGDISQAKLPDYFLVDYVRVYDAVSSTNAPVK